MAVEGAGEVAAVVIVVVVVVIVVVAVVVVVGDVINRLDRGENTVEATMVITQKRATVATIQARIVSSQAALPATVNLLQQKWCSHKALGNS